MAGAGAGNNITFPLDIDKLTSVALGAPPLSNEVGGVVVIVVTEAGPINEGSEVEESGRGLGSLEAVSHVLSLFVFGLDLEPEGVLSVIELPQVSDGVAIGVEVASANAQFSFYGLYKLVQALKVSKVISKQARSIF